MVEPTEDGKYEEQTDEVEALQSIFDETEFKLLSENPYSFEIEVNANSESEDRNHLKLLVRFDLPATYPETLPVIRLKNLSKEYLDSSDMYRYE